MLGRPVAYTTVAELVRTEPARAMIAAAGSYTLNGQDVIPRAARMMAPAVGNYTLNGQDVEFPITFSPTSYIRILLVGTTSSHIRYFKMAQNFQMVAGDSKTLVITVRNSVGDPVNITGSTIKWQAARSLGKASIISKTTSSGISLSDPTNGIFTVTLNPDDTEDLRGVYHHEAQVTDASNNISTVLSGTMTIRPPLIESTAT